MVTLPDGGQLDHWVFHWAPEYVADPIKDVADPGDDLVEVQGVLPVRVRDKADTQCKTIATAVSLHNAHPLS